MEQLTSSTREATCAGLAEPLNTDSCFGCGPANPVGLHLVFEIAQDSDGLPFCSATIALPQHFQGGHRRLHGGIIATLLDEAMSKLNRPLGVKAVTRNLTVDYLKPVPTETVLTLRGQHVRRKGRKLFHIATVEDSAGAILAQAQGLFIIMPEDRDADSK